MSMTIPTVTFPDGRVIPALGLGTYQIGANGASVRDGVRALRHGIDLGMTLIDTAELYGSGHAEQVVGEAIEGIRDRVFITSKVHPKNASRSATLEACERSLRQLNIEQLDLYLLHWKGEFPVPETIEALERLKSDGKIARWGVSNLDMDDLAVVEALPGGANLMTNQILYNLLHRSIEHDMLPWSRQRGVPLMAYSPLEEGRLLSHPQLVRIATDRGATAAQVAIAFILSKGIVAIPKSSSVERVTENHAAAMLELGADDMAALDAAFPPPSGREPLELGW
jgi:diketogulonate reductase-like aldo/keto reductase